MPYLIDGNNLLGSWGARASGGDARLEVVRRVSAFCRARRGHATIVFDGKPLREGFATQDLGAVQIRFPAPGRDADSVIRQLVDAAQAPADWIVVTSDKPLYSYARTRGARVLRAHEWNLLERAQRERAASATDDKPERETDVEGWLKVFGPER